MKSRTWFALLIAAGACSEGSGFFSPGGRTELAKAEAKWKARPFADYRYEMQQSCFCPAELARWTRITVQGGQVVAAEPVEPTSPPSQPMLSLWSPIDSLFSRLRRASESSSTQEIYSDIVVDFDPALGYPTRIDWVSKPNIADAGATYQLRNLTPYDF